MSILQGLICNYLSCIWIDLSSHHEVLLQLMMRSGRRYHTAVQSPTPKASSESMIYSLNCVHACPQSQSTAISKKARRKEKKRFLGLQIMLASELKMAKSGMKLMKGSWNLYQRKDLYLFTYAISFVTSKIPQVTKY